MAQGASVRFAVLGPVRVWRGAHELDAGGPQARALLALLLLRAGQPVPVPEIVDVLWGPGPPPTAVNVVRRHVGSLRRLLEPGLPARAPGRRLVRGAGGYRLVTDGDDVDLVRFRGLREDARRAVAGGAQGRAVELLGQALTLWAGPVASGIAPEVRERLGADGLERERLAALREAADAALRAGVPGMPLARLREAATAHPLDEPLLARLVLALAATGRRAEALATYRNTCRRLAEELGIDPGPELHQAHRTALRETRDGDPAEPPPAQAVAARPVVPAQLPHDLPAFTGRHTELAELLDPLARTGEPAGTVLISALGGMAGVGKTTLAVHWAHRVADRYPDGQLYVDLRGFAPSGAVTDPGEAVRGFLHALGVPLEQVPQSLAAQAALYRSVLAGRRVLVLLDNARDAEQVRPLLPGTPGCLAIVTSRDDLTGLVAAHGARSLILRPFDAGQARDFLAGRLGAGRTAAEPRAVDEIVARCAGLPLALACVAARAALRPDFPLAAVAAELREARGSLDAFTRPGTPVDVATVFSWSTRAVSPAAARLFRLLALHPGPDVSAATAAALAGLPPRRARSLLGELAAVHLVTEPAPGRYGLHDLLRAHADDLLAEHHTEAERREARDRLFRHYVERAHAAGALLDPGGDVPPLPPAPPDPRAVPFADDGAALAWLTAEQPALPAVVQAAASSGHDRCACLLAWSLEPYFERRGHWHDGLAAQRTALGAALRLADPAMEARALRGLARAEGRLGLLDESRAHLDRALTLFTLAGDTAGRAGTHRSLGWTCEQEGDLAGALRHNQLALELFRTTGSRPAQASVLNSVGWYHALRGEYRPALARCFEALALLQDLGDRYGQAATWDSIAYAYHRLGRHPHALLGYRNALALYRALGVPYPEADTLTRMGDTHLATGDREGARAAWEQALALLDRLGHPDAERVRERLAGRQERTGAG
ncbi:MULTISPECIES: AfsR/SARP family transcriptional regulator [unclassified Streptomyces]|uniref:AfsR/SARP family transcriptional regulator n=1 Tax=unclassified Streptomyces TaxID=2593676 RepID=UPI0004C4BAF4|nr:MULTISPECIES: BTAD domain-containing putative transcriptional regulator [unclassified Streptomyces]KOV91351.1 AfsR family transcriptional regulator [Streptomyces sp. NRRL WC-3723]